MEEIYQKMWTSAFPLIRNGQVSLDSSLDNPFDNRRGLTLLLRPSPTILQNIQNFLDVAKKLEPEQYYYPLSDIHTTILSIISCRTDFSLNQIKVSDYKKLITKSLQKKDTFHLNYKGVTASTSGVLIKGYDDKERLGKIRTALRSTFQLSELENTIDQRYVLRTAHCTLIRFRQPLKNPKKFADFLANHQSSNFGDCWIDKLELVFNDWYQRKNKIKLLMEWDLKIKRF